MYFQNLCGGCNPLEYQGGKLLLHSGFIWEIYGFILTISIHLPTIV
ncbi:hypothetical protein PORCRE_1972 [Porphyromonas crevioricanis JCM 15906]|uniref:Uncharacterized protein n=1 Tax=Porphyromonas crevioricanis JCM 15906 TaxID=1305617 RepID=T1CST9_9PORP|nr:hypothetical protein PORCRE_1972 [Porphyromonas crevioricanis JCM 15906]